MSYYVFSLFHKHLPFEKKSGPSFKNLIYPSYKDDLCQVCLKFAWWLWRNFFKNIVNVFSQFQNYLTLEKWGVYHLKNLNSLYSRMICAKFGWNWPSGSWEEKFTPMTTTTGKANLSLLLRWAKNNMSKRDVFLMIHNFSKLKSISNYAKIRSSLKLSLMKYVTVTGYFLQFKGNIKNTVLMKVTVY